MHRTGVENTNTLRSEDLRTVDDFEDVEAYPLDLAHPHNNANNCVGPYLVLRFVIPTSAALCLPRRTSPRFAHIIAYVGREGLREEARCGLRDFLQRMGSSESDALVVAALRPRPRSADCALDDVDAPVAIRALVVAEASAREAHVDSDVSSGHAALGDCGPGEERSPEGVAQDFRRLRDHLATMLACAADDDDRHIMHVRAQKHIGRTRPYRWLDTCTTHPKFAPRGSHNASGMFRAEYNRVTNCLLGAVGHCVMNAKRKRVKRCVRSCAGAALQCIRGDKAIGGTFTPEIQASK